jgi:hypothetical protein
VYECNQELEIFSCFLLISGEIEQGSRHNPDEETIVYQSFALIIPRPGNRFRVSSEKCRLLLSATPRFPGEISKTRATTQHQDIAGV